MQEADMRKLKMKNETVKNQALFSSIINGIMMESRLRISIPWECFQFFNQIETLSHLHHSNSNPQSRKLIGTVGIAKFGPK